MRGVVVDKEDYDLKEERRRMSRTKRCRRSRAVVMRDERVMGGKERRTREMI